MKRSVQAATAFAVLAALCGCSLCQSPFDYCGPVNRDDGCQNCNVGARRGSIFAPVDGIPATTTAGPPPGIGTDPAPPDPEPHKPTPSPELEPELAPRTTSLDNGDRLE
jgi:hypothetical protein